MAFCVALALVGVETVGFYGLAVGIPPLIAVAIAVSREHNLVEPGPPAPWAELTSNLGYLLAGSVFAAFLINAGPITVQLLATPDEETLAGAFTTSTVIARVPLFLFQAVQASLLPKLAALAGAGKFADFRSGFRRLLTVVIALGAVAIVGAFLIGPLVIRILFGEEYDLGRRNITMLAASSALYMVGISMSQALIALHGHARVAIGWICGTIVFIGVVAAGNELLLRVEAGLVAGSRDLGRGVRAAVAPADQAGRYARRGVTRRGVPRLAARALRLRRSRSSAVRPCGSRRRGRGRPCDPRDHGSRPRAASPAWCAPWWRRRRADRPRRGGRTAGPGFTYFCQSSRPAASNAASTNSRTLCVWPVRDHVVVGLVLLQHEPHRLRRSRRRSPSRAWARDRRARARPARRA